MAHVSMQDFLKRNSWYGLRRYVKVHHSRAFIDVLWRPRPWLEAHIECAERACAFGPDPYLVVSKSRRGGGERLEKVQSDDDDESWHATSPRSTSRANASFSAATRGPTLGGKDFKGSNRCYVLDRWV